MIAVLSLALNPVASMLSCRLTVEARLSACAKFRPRSTPAEGHMSRACAYTAACTTDRILL
jgi:hypothetical protein